MSLSLRQSIRNDTKLNIYKDVAMCCMLCNKIDPIMDLCHVYSSSRNGPRPYTNYDEVRRINPNTLFNDEKYILVLCPNCHRKIDYRRGANYSPSELLEIKHKYISNYNKVKRRYFTVNLCTIIIPTISLTLSSLYFYHLIGF